jgi:predicted dithiol-disulfide oxidoreductase (DUF899 family)
MAPQDGFKKASDKMEDHALVSRQDWTAARLEVLAEEKALMRHADALAAKRRAMPSFNASIIARNMFLTDCLNS